jgi:glycosyltransferase involved in cell wall biosynthesis
MAAQVVPVVSNVGANGEIVTDGKEGFLCATEDEWVDRLLELARNPAKRIEMGRAAREKAVSQYSVSVAAGRLLQIFREVVGDHSLGGRPVAASAFQPNES